MAFSFNFGGEEEEVMEKEMTSQSECMQVVELYAPIEVDRDLIPCEPLVFTSKGDDVTLYKKVLQNVEYELKQLAPMESGVAQALANRTDLIPRVYEGGLKTWECAIDLTQFLLMHYQADSMQGVRVLELGCGSALPGICLLRMGAHVDFLDYNKEVVEHLTIPNVFLNLPESTNPTADRCRFFAGDWSNFNQSVNIDGSEEGKYDLILTSETIYNLDTQPSLFATIKGALRHNNQSTVYVAAKTHYFGVGGSTRSFKNMVAKDDSMELSICANLSEGVGREIMCLTWK